MKGKLLYFLTIFLVLSAMITPEVEGRRKILKGRRTITRTYYRNLIIPAWAIILLVGVGQIVIGGVLYVILKKFILDPPLTGLYSPPTEMDA